MPEKNKHAIFAKLRNSLSLPYLHDFFSNLIVGGRKELIKKYIRPNEGDKILDLGCGTGGLLGFLPENISYYGFDISKEYIERAKKKFKNRQETLFECIDINDYKELEPASFDIVVANGVLHHLSDPECTKLIDIARVALKSTGRFIAVDCCYTDGQSKLSRYLVSRDRGEYVRKSEEYLKLAKKTFHKIEGTIRQDMLNIPYSLIIMEGFLSD